jgi:hypothetical protein
LVAVGSQYTQRVASFRQALHGPYQLLWDNVHDKPGLFVDAVQRLAERGDPLRVLAAYRDQYGATMRERVTPDFCRQAGIQPEALHLRPFDRDQAAEMVRAVDGVLNLELDAAAQQAFARHVQQGDGGPFFALSIGRVHYSPAGRPG